MTTTLGGCGGTEPQVVEAFEWEPCSWSSERRDSLAECAQIRAPLDARAPDGAAFQLGIKRRRAAGTARAQLWVLAGGPGDAATEGIEFLAHGARAVRDDLDVYAVDHRGTGGSERLVCTSADLAECGAELEATQGARLGYFSSAASARDLSWLIEQLTPAGTQLFIYGGSYGTYLAQRYLSLQPERPNGVILEGVARPHRPLSGYDAAMNESGEALFERCAASPACRARFDSHPGDAAAAALVALERGACPDLGLTADEARELFATAALATELVPWVPALARRIARCSAGDALRIQHFAARLAALGERTLGSDALGAHVAISELLGADADKDAPRLRAALRSYTLATGLEASLAAVAGAWPAYSPPPPAEPWAYTGPLLMLQGALDPATSASAAAEVASRYTGARQRLYVFPEAAHNVLGATRTHDGRDCASWLYTQFLTEPRETLEDTCMQDLPPLEFEGDPQLARYLFGGEAWE